ncbi:peptide ABC transporter substrate-binding protein [Oculatella sp. FACHB-28]|uniref:ABC transporter substrate-binding protein n=1 Tax=Oculatella sp. FACHB-28 TaxID=2692845 RepID=UPI0016881A9C|nr:ABC transporter substrate-binding protein [Oculatella sp. FACHB-28]MBD2057157.1 peptide ABC transporter substrate-binding protein [Oculatella sp. FACHB-28]
MSGSGFAGRFGFSRRGWRSLLQFFTLFSLCIALIVGCGGALDTEQPASPAASGEAGSSRITMGTTQKVETLDPADAYTIFTGILLYNMGDRLYTYEPGTTDLVPQLATEMPTVSDDGLTYTIPLREGVTLHDGTAFNAEVMKFSIDRFIQNGGGPAFLLGDVVNSVEASGEYELTITLKAEFAGFPALLSFWGVTPVPPDAYEIGEGSFKPDSFIGTGPYKLASLNADSIKLDVNEDYWGEPPANQGIDIQIYASPANLYNTFRTSGLDIAYQTLDPDQIASLQREEESGGWEVIEAGTNVINYMTLNQKIEPTSDLNVRKAIAAMIDRNLINERVFQGNAEPLYSMIPTSFEIYKPVFEQAYGDGDFNKARAFLEEAGYSESNPLNLEIWYPSASTERSIIANTLKESIEQGLPGLVTVAVNSAERATLSEGVDTGLYETVLLNWYPDFYDPDNFTQPFFSCDQGSPETLCEKGASQGNGSFYYSQKANDLITQERAEQDPAARDAVFTELQDLSAEDVPYIPLWQNKDYVFVQDGIENVSIEPTQQFLLWQISK